MNGLKGEFPDRLSILSVDVQSSLGQELTGIYGKFTPTFVFFDQEGQERWRSVGVLDPDQVRDSIQ